MEKQIAIIGATGLIGSALKEHLKKFKIISVPGRSFYDSPESIARKLTDIDLIINLAGYPINGRWTKKRKKEIHKSRIELTSNLVKAISLLDKRPAHLISASAIGIYEDDGLYDESVTDYADNNLAKLVINWESAMRKVKELNVKLTVMRLGIVLSRKGGAYKSIRKIIKLGLGGKMGTGKQGYSFIIIDDVVRAIEFIIDKKIYGVVNLVCPEPVDNLTFIKGIAKKLKRPSIFTLPAWLIKSIFSEGSILILKGQKVIPGVLLKHNFRFVGNNLNSCLDILEK